MTLSVTIYFPAHCGHTGSPDWGDVPQGRLWVESRPRATHTYAVQPNIMLFYCLCLHGHMMLPATVILILVVLSFMFL